MTSFRDFDQAMASLKVTEAGDYVYYTSLDIPEGTHPFAVIHEDPAVTAIIPLHEAKELGLDTSQVYRRFVLSIEDSLTTPGLTAAIAQNLAAMSITCNVVTAYYNAYAFIPRDDAQNALHALEDLSKQARDWVKASRF